MAIVNFENSLKQNVVLVFALIGRSTSNKNEFRKFQLCDASNQKTHKNKVVANKNRHLSF